MEGLGFRCQNRTKFNLCVDDSSSIMDDWQRVRIQENDRELPDGTMPRTVDVIIRGEIVETWPVLSET